MVEVASEDVEALAKITSTSFAGKVVEMFKSGPPSEEEKKQVTSESIDDRQIRGQVHQEIRRIFESKIETSTNDEGAIIATMLPPRFKGKKRGGRNQNRGPKAERPAGEYLHFTLYKDNRDTLDAVNQIARMMRIKPQFISYAGTKDRRASSAQRCSVRNQRDKALAGINGKLWGIVTGDYSYENVPIHLGQLSGNEFTIVVKNCKISSTSANGSNSIKAASEQIKASAQTALDHMATHGWLNYFGHQRFGTHDIGTHEVGKLLLSGQFESAVNAILYYDPAVVEAISKGQEPENPAEKDVFARHQACMLFQTNKDIKKALETMPRRFSAENTIMRHLTRQDGDKSRKDFIGAIITITRGLRNMYLHAYQSSVWNHAASRRWELHGSKVVQGDLVLVEAAATPLIGGQDEDGYDIINPVAGDDDDDDSRPLQARALSEEEAQSGKYTIYDVVLPSPGYDVIYPSNELGEFYKEFMGREENGGLDPLDMRRKHREFSLPGRYRKLINRFLAKPSLEVKLYSDDTEQMHPTDLDTIKAAAANKTGGKRSAEDTNNGPLVKRVKVEEEANASTEEKPTAQAAENGGAATSENEKIAVIVKFQLGKSAYATITLRELMGEPLEDN